MAPGRRRARGLAQRALPATRRRRSDAPASARGAGCPDGRVCSPRRSWSRTCASTGGSAPRISPTTGRRRRGEQLRQLAVGRRNRDGHANEPHVQPARARHCASTQRGTTSAATSPSSPHFRRRRSTSRGNSGPKRSHGSAIRRRSSTTPRRGPRRRLPSPRDGFGLTNPMPDTIGTRLLADWSALRLGS